MILLCNDDGIDAPGMKALEASIDEEYCVVAPAKPMSECGHRVTTATPIQIDTIDSQHHAVHGTPADCIRVALYALKLKPTLVLSGINHGGNLGVDIYISGTCAAAREASIHGLPAIAFSHYRKRDLKLNWKFASAMASHCLKHIQYTEIKPHEYYNINFPHLADEEKLPAIVPCHASKDPLPLQYEKQDRKWQYSGAYSERLKRAKTDVQICFDGEISLSTLNL